MESEVVREDSDHKIVRSKFDPELVSEIEKAFSHLLTHHDTYRDRYTEAEQKVLFKTSVQHAINSLKESFGMSLLMIGFDPEITKEVIKNSVEEGI